MSLSEIKNFYDRSIFVIKKWSDIKKGSLRKECDKCIKKNSSLDCFMDSIIEEHFPKENKLPRWVNRVLFYEDLRKEPKDLITEGALNGHDLVELSDWGLQVNSVNFANLGDMDSTYHSYTDDYFSVKIPNNIIVEIQCKMIT